MSGLSEERRKEIERWLGGRAQHDTGSLFGYAVQCIRDLLAESAALRTERDALERQKAATNEALADALELAAHNGRTAPASPDDLARVALREIARETDDPNVGSGTGEIEKIWAVVTRVHQIAADALDALARLTPPTGPA